MTESEETDRVFIEIFVFCPPSAPFKSSVFSASPWKYICEWRHPIERGQFILGRTTRLLTCYSGAHSLSNEMKKRYPHPCTFSKERAACLAGHAQPLAFGSIRFGFDSSIRGQSRSPHQPNAMQMFCVFRCEPNPPGICGLISAFHFLFMAAVGIRI